MQVLWCANTFLRLLYVDKTTNFSSQQGQEEMMTLFSNYILNTIADQIRAEGIFGIMIDGTQDTEDEQKSICIRHVNYEVHEDLIHFRTEIRRKYLEKLMFRLVMDQKYIID